MLCTQIATPGHTPFAGLAGIGARDCGGNEDHGLGVACRTRVVAVVLNVRVTPCAEACAVARILGAFPRLRMKDRFSETCCRLVTARPETSHDNFLRDFGERFVPGYKAVSTVDLLMNARFDE